MKKKLMICMLAGTMVLSAAACGKKNDTTEVSSETATAETETATTDSTEEVTGTDEAIEYVAIEDLNTDEYVTLCDYMNMTVQADKPEVTDEIITNYINGNILKNYPITDRAAQNGDKVTIDFVGKKDGVAFDGGSSEGYELTLGAGQFIEGFEEGLVGVKPGETVDLKLTFPADYRSTELAGQDVVFTVTMQNILEVADYDTVTEEQLVLMGLENQTKKTMWTEAKNAVEESAQISYEGSISNAILDQLLENCTFASIPDDLVKKEVADYNEYMESLCAAQYGCDLQTYVETYGGITMEDYNAQLQAMAEDTVKQYLIIEAIARAEGLTLTEEELMEKAEEEAVLYGYESAEALLEAADRTAFRMYMIQERVLDMLQDKVTVESVSTAE